MSCLRIKNNSGSPVTILGDGGNTVVLVLASSTSENIYSNETIGSMLVDLETYKADGTIDYEVTPHIALPRDPTSNDDKTKGVQLGTRWFNYLMETTFYCKDTSEGSAQWSAVIIPVLPP